jgi:catechol 2,3-dioxygenase-like lactoylglutathione lyase family enzyme
MPLSIQSVMHVNINCSDLERSLAFYRDAVGLVPQDHTNPVPQDGAGFGMTGSVQWDAHILQDARGYAGPAVDLLQWMVPMPVGTPGQALSHIGLNRLCVVVPDVDAVYRRVVAAGYRVANDLGIKGDALARFFVCRDPDGVAIEFREDPRADHPLLHHVNVNCSDIGRSLDWYERVIGLEARAPSPKAIFNGDAYGLSADADLEGRFLWPPEQDAFAIELIEWKSPKPTGSSAASANQLGLYRMAFMVPDIQWAYDEIKTQGVACRPPVFLDMGPEIPIDGVWALFFPDPDGTCMELIETPTLNVEI